MGGALLGLVWLACSGGSGGIGGGSSGTPQERCERFIGLMNECYTRAGRSTQLPSNCQNATLSDQLLVQIDCSLENPSGYCKTIGAVLGDGGRLDPFDPEVRALNACTSMKSLQSPCKEAFQVVYACGGQLGFSADCRGQSATLATCINQHPVGACQIYGAREAGSPVNTPEIQALQKCQTDALRGDGG